MALACAGYGCFSAQDAMAKWLVQNYDVPQILVVRCLVIFLVSESLARYWRHPSILKSPHRNTVLIRTALLLAAWLAMFTAARHLSLGELTTLYFIAPIIIVFLSALVLRERAGTIRWLACGAGFIGVVIAANPTQTPDLWPALLVIFAAFCWAWTTILVRLVSRTESTLKQMSATSLLFAGACALTLPWLWKTPDAGGWGLMIALGLVSALGQFLVYEGFRYAPASVIAPTEYTGLIWAFLLGYLIWAEIPTARTLVGAALVVGASLALLWWEQRSLPVEAR
ncbi:DMT family transporter [Sinorhizobium meliloti]|uniref:DMT family transporter n=1 Tax=Rhizobium meliloti TaxID=382 RepID=UPI003D64DE00